MRRPLALVLSLTLVACGGDAGTADSAAGSAATADADRAATGGGGIPSGYVARGDREDADLSGARYASSGGNAWEVTTGPAHIIYAAGDSASGNYTARATFEQLEAPSHPEAYGIFVGGQGLDGTAQRYTYFLVRGTGEYLVKVRDGGETRNVVSWTKSEAVPMQDEAGKGKYRLAIEVGADSVRFVANDQRVAAVARSAVPVDGIAGVRINHNLHVATGPVEIVRQ